MSVAVGDEVFSTVSCASDVPMVLFWDRSCSYMSLLLQEFLHDMLSVTTCMQMI